MKEGFHILSKYFTSSFLILSQPNKSILYSTSETFFGKTSNGFILLESNISMLINFNFLLEKSDTSILDFSVSRLTTKLKSDAISSISFNFNSNSFRLMPALLFSTTEIAR